MNQTNLTPGEGANAKIIATLGPASASPDVIRSLIQAGADRVVLPATIGAQRMAAMITRPSTVELLELVAGHDVVDVAMDELMIPAESLISIP